jgi:putative NIF3 family GTP cyclohydrolase 1 type 2
MLRSADTVEHVYCCSFPTPEVSASVLAMIDRPSLVFAHHPVDLEVSGRGFLPIAPETLDAMKDARCSFYSMHAPLDCDRECGTSAAILEALDLKEIDQFFPYGNGYAGRITEVEPTGSLGFLRSVRQVFGVPRLEIGGTLQTQWLARLL